MVLCILFIMSWGIQSKFYPENTNLSVVSRCPNKPKIGQTFCWMNLQSSKRDFNGNILTNLKNSNSQLLCTVKLCNLCQVLLQIRKFHFFRWILKVVQQQKNGNLFKEKLLVTRKRKNFSLKNQTLFALYLTFTTKDSIRT